MSVRQSSGHVVRKTRTMEIQVLNLQRVRALETWLEATKTKVTQVNGQRRYGGPPEGWHGPTPGEHCEIYISQIPRDAYEDLLLPLFSSVGPLWEFRLMMNFSGQNRGFAYAKYGSPAVASRAVSQLHNRMLEPGFCLNVRRSTEKRQLCVGELPATTRREDLLQVLRGLAEGVKWLSLKIEPDVKGVSAIVAFSSHHTASMAKKRLVEAFKKQFDLAVTVKWHSSLAMSPKEPWDPRTPSRCLPLPAKPPQRVPKCPPPPPHPDPPGPVLQGFCRAVTKPKAKPPCSLAASSQGRVLSAASSVTVLEEEAQQQALAAVEAVVRGLSPEQQLGLRSQLGPVLTREVAEWRGGLQDIALWDHHPRCQTPAVRDGSKPSDPSKQDGLLTNAVLVLHI